MAPLLEIPAGGDDFEWDECGPSWNVTGPTAAKLTPSNAVATKVPQITNGMATLTANDANAGFLGSVSGSALLRLI